MTLEDEIKKIKDSFRLKTGSEEDYARRKDPRDKYDEGRKPPAPDIPDIPEVRMQEVDESIPPKPKKKEEEDKPTKGEDIFSLEAKKITSGFQLPKGTYSDQPDVHKSFHSRGEDPNPIGMEEYGRAKKKLDQMMEQSGGDPLSKRIEGSDIFLKIIDEDTRRIEVYTPSEEKKEKPEKQRFPKQAFQPGVTPCYQTIDDARAINGHIPIKTSEDGIGFDFERQQWGEAPGTWELIPPQLFDRNLTEDIFKEEIDECEEVTDHGPGLYVNSQTTTSWGSFGLMMWADGVTIGFSPSAFPNFNYVYHPSGSVLGGESWFDDYNPGILYAGGVGELSVTLANRRENITETNSQGNGNVEVEWTQQARPSSYCRSVGSKFASSGNYCYVGGSYDGVTLWYRDLNYRTGTEALGEAWQFQYSTCSYIERLAGLSPLVWTHFINIDGITIGLGTSTDLPPRAVTNRIYSPTEVGNTYHLYSFYYRQEALAAPTGPSEWNPFDHIRYGVIIKNPDGTFAHYTRDFEARYHSYDPNRGSLFCHDLEVEDQTYLSGGDFILIHLDPRFYDQSWNQTMNTE